MKRLLVLTLLLPLLSLQGADARRAVAFLKPAQGYDGAKGVVFFSEAKDGVRIEGSFTGLKPGKHGFHIHEKGECSPPDFSSAGGHYNPLALIHGAPDAPKRHVGDLGNIEVDQKGKAHYVYIDRLVTLSGPNSVIGKALIVHEKPDDLKSQPTGAAGARILCGVIVEESPED